MRYEAPESLDKAAALLAAAQGDARVLAGGTDLLVQLRADVLSPELVVDIKKITETRTITEEKGGFRIGAAVTGAELKEHAKLKKAWPGVVEGMELVKRSLLSRLGHERWTTQRRLGAPSAFVERAPNNDKSRNYWRVLLASARFVEPICLTQRAERLTCAWRRRDEHVPR